MKVEEGALWCHFFTTTSQPKPYLHIYMKMLTYISLFIIGSAVTGVAMVCVFSVIYLTRLDRLREASLSLSDNLSPSDGEDQ
jgi:hypothetical protein